MVQSSYKFTRPIAIGIVSTITLLFILVPVLWGVVNDVRSLAARRLPDGWKHQYYPAVWGILVAGIVDAFAYSIRGSISTKSFSMIFPAIALFYVGSRSSRKLLYGFSVILVLTSMVKIGIFYNASYVIQREGIGSTVVRTAPSAQWIQDHVEQPTHTLLADLNLYGKYLLKAVGKPSQPILQSYTLRHFEHVIGVPSEPLSSIPDLVAIDMASYEPTLGFVWVVLDPLNEYSAQIRANPDLHLVYDDGAIWLGRLTGR